MNSVDLAEITKKAKRVMERYQKEFPEVKINRDYLPFKITEEWGECLQAYLMYTDRSRQKGRSKDEIKEMLSQEFADVFAYLLVFADVEGIDPIEAITKKWFSHLKEE